MEIFQNVNWLAVLAGGFIYMVVGSIWYGPIAGKAWLKEVGMTEEEIREKGLPVSTMVKSFLSALVMSTGLGLILYNPGGEDWAEGALIGFAVAILLVGGATLPNYLFEDKSFKHFLIHLGNAAIALTATGALMGFWQ